jgi:hypothetical protein
LQRLAIGVRIPTEAASAKLHRRDAMFLPHTLILTGADSTKGGPIADWTTTQIR